MAAKVKYNITLKVGSYQDREGNTKGSYKTVGMVMEKDDNSRFIMIDPTFNFAAIKREEGRDMLICSLMEPKEKEPKPAASDNQWEE
jgi:hypothetical protein